MTRMLLNGSGLADRSIATWVIILSSAWASWVLATPPSNFAAFPSSFRVAQAFGTIEPAWATFIGIGAVLHFLAIVIRERRTDKRLSRFLAAAGMSIEGFFWLAFGGSTLHGNPDTLFGFPALLIGTAAVAKIVIMGLRVPDGR